MNMNEDINRVPEKNQHVNEQHADYDRAEMDLLRDGLKRTHQERFLFATMLYKVQQTLKKATITYKADNLKK